MSQQKSEGAGAEQAQRMNPSPEEIAKFEEPVIIDLKTEVVGLPQSARDDLRKAYLAAKNARRILDPVLQRLADAVERLNRDEELERRANRDREAMGGAEERRSLRAPDDREGAGQSARVEAPKDEGSGASS